jgi:hypothetical protein
VSAGRTRQLSRASLSTYFSGLASESALEVICSRAQSILTLSLSLSHLSTAVLDLDPGIESSFRVSAIGETPGKSMPCSQGWRQTSYLASGEIASSRLFGRNVVGVSDCSQKCYYSEREAVEDATMTITAALRM